MNVKAVLLLFLLFFASVFAIALINISITTNHPKSTLSTSKFGVIQPTGGEPVDDPTAT